MDVQGQTRLEPFGSSKTSTSRGERQRVGGWTRVEEVREGQKQHRARRKADAEGRGWQLTSVAL